MAAYSALLSQLQLLKHLQLSDGQRPFPVSQIHRLQTLLSYLKAFLEDLTSFGTISITSSDAVRDLEAQIRDAVQEAEDVIESAEEISCSSVLQKIDLIVARARDFRNNSSWWDFLSKLETRAPAKYPAHDALSRSELEGNKLVGRDGDLRDLIGRLTECDTTNSLQVVPIVGIRGIGKTILAKYVYKHETIRRHFKRRGWVSLRGEYRKRDILVGLLRSMKKLQGDDDPENLRTDEQLTKYLYKCLMHRTYVVVLDNLSSGIESSWNALKDLFPNQDNGSRVVVTTRNMDVPLANTVIAPPHLMKLLSEEENWYLLREFAFPDRMCPPEFQELAYNITKICKGLPLATVTMGKLLTWMRLTISNWRDVLTLARGYKDYDHLIELLVSLTYSRLPQLLKACLLYLGIFPQDYEIPVPKLINLWIAEGYLQPSGSKALEEIGEECLLQLIERGIVSICEWRSNGRVKTCRISDVYCDFIIRKAAEEKHFYAINQLATEDGFLDDNYDDQRWLGIHKNIFSSFKETSKYLPEAALSVARSLVYTGPQDHYPLRGWLDFKLLRVLDALRIRFYSFPPEILKLVRLKYLAFSFNGEVPSSICKLQSLQFLIILQYLNIKHLGSPRYLPVEIWDMKELRHLHVMGSDLPEPYLRENNDCPLLENLTTLLGVSARSCTPRILEQIKSLKKLEVEIAGVDAWSFFSHLLILDVLESLKCVYTCRSPESRSQTVASIITPAFPQSLKTLTLSGWGFSWKHMETIAELPNLEVLKLKKYAFCGPGWVMRWRDNTFRNLKFLLMEDLNIEYWDDDATNFRVLVRLIMKHCYKLWRIPLHVGHIQTIEMIEAFDCRTSVGASIQHISEQQLELGNKALEHGVYYSFDEEEDFEL